MPSCIKKQAIVSVSNPGFLEPETRFFWLICTTQSLFLKKKLELLLYSNISDSDNTEVVD